jgi:hypothetical protein
MHTPNELQEIMNDIQEAIDLLAQQEKITIDAAQTLLEAVQNEWWLEDMADLPEDEMEAELKMWWAGRELV